MKKLKHLVLMLCLTLSGAWCYAYGVAGTENGKDGTPIEVIEKTSVTESDKSNSIVPTIDGHVLSLMFSENLGEVAVEITTVSGTLMENLWVRTPNGLQTYLPLCGDYIITFTLPNGDEYYGEFTVMD